MRQVAAVCLGLLAVSVSAETMLTRSYKKLDDDDDEPKPQDPHSGGDGHGDGGGDGHGDGGGDGHGDGAEPAPYFGPGHFTDEEKEMFEKWMEENQEFVEDEYGEVDNFVLVPVSPCEELIPMGENCFQAPSCCDLGNTCVRYSKWFAKCVETASLVPPTPGHHTPTPHYHNTPMPPHHTPTPHHHNTPMPPHHTPMPPHHTPMPPHHTPTPHYHNTPQPPPQCGTYPQALWSMETGHTRRQYLEDELNRVNGRYQSGTVLAEKYEQMLASPFKFFRGASHLYYTDLAKQGVMRRSKFYDPLALSWLTGDMHVENIGGFDNSKGEIVLDLNDFDDSWVASYMYDIYRMATSMVFVGREAGFTPCQVDNVLDAFSGSYLSTMEGYMGNDREKTDYMSMRNAKGMIRTFLEETESGNSRKKMLDKWAPLQGSTRKICCGKKAKKVAEVTPQERDALTRAIESYHRSITGPLRGRADYFKVVHVARRLKAGTGSRGTNRFYVLIEGEGGVNGNRILDVKEQGYPAIYPTLSTADQQRITNIFPEAESGCRAATANRAMLNNEDHHIGCVDVLGMTFSVRERSPFKEDFEPEFKQPGEMVEVAKDWGWILAGAHARSDIDFHSAFVKYQLEDAVTRDTKGKEAAFKSEVRSFASVYVDQVNRDFEEFKTLFAF